MSLCFPCALHTEGLNLGGKVPENSPWPKHDQIFSKCQGPCEPGQALRAEVVAQSFPQPRGRFEGADMISTAEGILPRLYSFLMLSTKMGSGICHFSFLSDCVSSRTFQGFALWALGLCLLGKASVTGAF